MLELDGHILVEHVVDDGAAPLSQRCQHPARRVERHVHDQVAMLDGLVRVARQGTASKNTTVRYKQTILKNSSDSTTILAF